MRLVLLAVVVLLASGCDGDTRLVEVTSPPDTVAVRDCHETCELCKKLKPSIRARSRACSACGCAR